MSVFLVFQQQWRFEAPLPDDLHKTKLFTKKIEFSIHVFRTESYALSYNKIIIDNRDFQREYQIFYIYCYSNYYWIY